ncbi:MAG: HU family DNA-binding protein [Ignavibacteriae bacterium]|nr:HU family DNA-binding protein [Ignavibacteriota bacterium]
MNKKSLLNKIIYKSTLRKDTAEKIFDRMFELMKESVKENKGFGIDEFGNFEVIHIGMRKEFDSKKKSEVLIPPKDKVLFTPSGVLLDNINETVE